MLQKALQMAFYSISLKEFKKHKAFKGNIILRNGLIIY